MIKEALQHLFTPAPKPVKKLGYVYEAIAVDARYKRCHAAWNPHLETCHKVILNAAEKLHPENKIIILGSGGLHDIPTPELLERRLDLILVDIVHLPNVKERYKDHPQVSFIEEDVTGRVIPDPTWNTLEADLIISLNLLSQLPLNLPEDKKDGVMEEHIEWLRNCTAKTLLISDMKRMHYKGDEQIKSEHAIPNMPEPNNSWNWDIAPEGETERGVSIIHKVGCWESPDY